MKTRNKLFTRVLLLGLAAWTLTSCQDWLTLYPQTQVVEEDYWKDRSDLEGVRYAAYTQMCSTVRKLAIWGDLRSDSYDLNPNDQTTVKTAPEYLDIPVLYREIRDGRIERDSASTYFDWSDVYTTINYCNKVLQHGPDVLENDKQFTTAEWLQIRAEMIAMRALNYFYLIRAFKDVPYTTKVINNDTEVEYFGATNQLVVLDSLIADVENVKGQARNRFSTTRDTKGLITNAAIYALLSDMYLWRASLHEGRGLNEDIVTITNIPGRADNPVTHTVDGDYQLCIDYADLALQALAEQNEYSRLNASDMAANSDETTDYGLTNCNLIKNDFEMFSSGKTPELTAFKRIFSEGNSEESIFELQFSSSDDRKNPVVDGPLWGDDKSYTHLIASQAALNTISSGNDFNRDSRMWFSAWGNEIDNTSGRGGTFCTKWGSLVIKQEGTLCSSLATKAAASTYSNWIVYRISDVMLQKAEALAMLNNKEALDYVNAIHRRWYCNDSPTDPTQPSEDLTDGTTLGNAPQTASARTKDAYETCVFNERQLEFLGEGKRWFDLVRYAERHAGGQDGTRDPREWTEECPIGSGQAGVEAMANKFLKNHFTSNPSYTTLINRFKNRYGLYGIIYYMEIKASNGKLEQNPVWNKSTYEQ